MFAPGTLIVLGAAVSAEVEMPLGWKLKEQISALLPKVNGAGDDYVRYALFQDGQPFDQHSRAVGQLAAALPKALSIDNLVEHRGADEAFKLVAKVGIVSAILKAEGKSLLRRKPNAADGTLNPGKQTTYAALFSVMLSGVPVGRLEEAIDRVAFINFNYDRCLEHYFRDWLIGYSGLPQAKASVLAARLVVERPYGWVAPLPWMEAEGALDFGCELDVVPLRRHASNILTFSEERGSDVEARIRRLTAGAAQIIFLGCAFHRQNLDLLRPDDSAYRYAWGTCYMPPPEDACSKPSLQEFAQPTIEAFKSELYSWPVESGHRQASFEPLTCLQLIEKYRAAWTAPRD